MSEEIVNEIRDAVRGGAKLAVGRNYYGGVRLMFSKGLFGWRKWYISVSELEFQQLIEMGKLRRMSN